MTALDDIVHHSNFHFAGAYVWARASAVRHPETHLMVTRDDKETTVVTTPEQLADVDVVEVNPDRWLLLSIDCAHPFYCVGFIARISTPMSAAGIDILVVSTFSRDWVFVREEDATRAAGVLSDAGFHYEEPR
jgi:hypothetical protein